MTIIRECTGSLVPARWTLVPDGALSHQPFLLFSTYPAAEACFNKINGLSKQPRTAREPLLARCALPALLLWAGLDGKSDAPAWRPSGQSLEVERAGRNAIAEIAVAEIGKTVKLGRTRRTVWSRRIGWLHAH